MNFEDKDHIESLTEEIYKENFYVYGKVWSSGVDGNSNSNYYGSSETEKEIRDILNQLSESALSDDYEFIIISVMK